MQKKAIFVNKQWMGLPLVVFGIGGFAREVKVLVDDINRSSHIPIFDLKGFISNSNENIGDMIEGIKVIASNDCFIEIAKLYDKLGVIIALGSPKAKQSIEEKILNKCNNLVYPNLIHPKANISSSYSNDYGMGNIICAGVTLTTNIKLGKFIILNINSTIGHDVIIEDYCTINPLSAISGNVIIRKGSLIGAGASIKEKLDIGKNGTVGLGAIVVKNVEEESIVICKAATKLEK